MQAPDIDKSTECARESQGMPRESHLDTGPRAPRWSMSTTRGRAMRTALVALLAAGLLPLVAGAQQASTEVVPAAAAAAPAALTAPTVVGFDKISAGDTAWMLTSSALVLMMTIPGLALFYAGMVRKKNVLATLMQSFAVTCLVTVLWMIAGYSLAFMPGSEYIGSLDRLFLSGMGYWKEANDVTVSHLA